MNGDTERLTTFWDLRFLRGGPLLQFFNGGSTGGYDRKEVGRDGLKLRFVEISLECRTQLFRVLLDEECKLAKLLSPIFERQSCPIVVGGPELRVDLGQDTGPSGDIYFTGGE